MSPVSGKTGAFMNNTVSLRVGPLRSATSLCKCLQSEDVSYNLGHAHMILER